MKRWKSFLYRLPIYLVLVAVVGTGFWYYLKQISLPEQLQEVLPTEPPPAEQGIPPEKLVKNIISIGDTFSVYPWRSTGHLDCKVLSARFVNEEADCPRSGWLRKAILKSMMKSMVLMSMMNGSCPADRWNKGHGW